MRLARLTTAVSRPRPARVRLHLRQVGGRRGDRSASTSSPPTGRYVALGDSYSAGPLIPTTDLAGGCARSDHNYPSLVARPLKVKTFVDVTCSGADDPRPDQRAEDRSATPGSPRSCARSPPTRRWSRSASAETTSTCSRRW